MFVTSFVVAAAVVFVVWFFLGNRSPKGKKIRGIVVLVKKNVLDFNDFNASFRHHIEELIFFLWESFLSCFGKQFLSMQLISADRADLHGNGKRGKKAYLKSWLWPSLKTGDSAYVMTFDWEEDIGVPGAFMIRNDHQNEFFLKSLTLLDVPGHGRVHFDCNSWVYPAAKYNYDRIFFVNKTCLLSETPRPLKTLRIAELENLRGGSGTVEELKEWDRVYDYACYNDLGGDKNLGPVLGGSEEHPYPRRGKTGRPIDKVTGRESRIRLVDGLSIYVPRDERFGHLKLKDFLGYALNSLFQVILARIKELEDGISKVKDIKTFNELKKLSIVGFELPKDVVDILKDDISVELLHALSRTSVEDLFKFPVPQVIQAHTMAWRTDEEFGREMLSGANPVSIRRLETFPPTSKLDAYYYGDQTSSIKEHHIKDSLEGGSMTIVEALEANRLFILDHHDALMPYVRRINATTTKIYATRTVLFLQKDGTLKPLAIELSLPHPDGDQFGAISEVYTPPAEEDGVQGWIWQFAKAYVAVNDSGVHQLISHWYDRLQKLNTHAVMEPFVIATNRQLSVMHPIHKLLHPHFRDTMNINAFARQTLISRGGVLEKTIFPGEFAMELSSDVYKKSWMFPEQGLPADLIKRGMAVKDCDGSLKLLIEDYPYAVDGLKIWSAIEKWVLEYCNIYYKNDETVQKDTELQAWWKELKEEGHGDKKHEPWWPKMQNREDLIDSCTIIIWVASALHAAVNFGQYAYGGYALNRPTTSLALMPKEYNNLETKPEEEFLNTFTCQLQTLIGVSLIEILSKHTSDEVYLGQRDSDEWTTDKAALDAFETFGKTMETIDYEISVLNKVAKKKNRVGPVEVPYTLLSRTSGEGLTGKGIPNSVSI